MTALGARLEYIKAQAEAQGLVVQVGEVVPAIQEYGRPLHFYPKDNGGFLSATCWANGDVHLSMAGGDIDSAAPLLAVWAGRVRALVQDAPAGVPVQLRPLEVHAELVSDELVAPWGEEPF